MQWWCAAQGTAWSWSWTPYPGVWLFVAALTALIVRLHLRFGISEGSERQSLDARESPEGVVAADPHALGWAFVGIVLLWIALDWPVGALGAGYLASVHMVQFLLIAVAAPPLLLLGIPRPALHRLAEGRFTRLAVRVLGAPLVSIFVFASLMGVTHWPWLADTLMSRQWGSFVLDMIWLFSGIVFWWPVVANLPERDWLQEPFKIGYLIAATLVNTGVFAYLTFSEVPVYATFELAPPVGSLSTRDDQLIAGLLMKVGGALILWTSITILWFRWVNRSEAEGGAPGAGGGAGSRLAGRSSTVVVLLAALAAAACSAPSPGANGDADANHEGHADMSQTGAEAGASASASGSEVTWTAASEGLDMGPVVIGAPVTPERAALYLRVRSTGANVDTLVAIEVEGVGEVSLHHTRSSGGMMQMVHAHGGFPLPAGAELQLQPGGDHAMLEAIEQPLRAASTRAVVLHFARAGAVTAEAQVVDLTRIAEALGLR